ncbi:RED-like protein N-terminal region-domain-containing protein [Cubamyces lactineus]|nr:RED-like protein N-terminal region-domain-containing protein [Cubamyces lactineus]
MDQESFRKLLQAPKASSSSPPAASSAHVRGSLLAAATTASKDKKAKKIDASQPAFKPRQVKKGAKGDAYRDRATERRLGIANDYAQVEALADEFERRNAENEDRQAVEEQRKYLGGDSEHTVLVKGLDFALLEQTRARVAAETAATEDVSLEEAYMESVAQPKKRTREEILRELKSKRGAPDTQQGTAAAVPAAALSAADKALEEAKKAGKFKPIGFKPVGGAAEKGEKAKRKKKAKPGEAEENGERKKKRKVTTAAAAASQGQAAEGAAVSGGPSDTAAPEQPEAGPSNATSQPSEKPPPAPEPEPVDEDFDIFADAGEYTGVDLGDESDTSEDNHANAKGREDGERPGEEAPPPRKWLATSDDEREPSRAVSQPPLAGSANGRSQSRSMSPQRRAGLSHKSPVEEIREIEEGEEEEERPMRLQPLASSALPSIKDLLAMSEEAEKAEKRRARKEKKKAGGGAGGSEMDTKAKVERDYQRLKAYTEKKSKA